MMNPTNCCNNPSAATYCPKQNLNKLFVESFLTTKPILQIIYRSGTKCPPAVVVSPQTALSIGVFKGVVRVLEGLVPEEAGFTAMQAGLVLEAPVVLSVGSVTLWTKETWDGENEDLLLPAMRD